MTEETTLGRVKRPVIKSISRSNNPTPPKQHHTKDRSQIAKPYHSTKHSKAEESQVFSPDSLLQALFSSTKAVNLRSALETSSSVVLPCSPGRKDLMGVLVTELADDHKLNIRSLNVSWMDSCQMPSSSDQRPCTLNPSLNSSYLENGKLVRNLPERTSAKLMIEIEDHVIPELNESQPSSPVRVHGSIRENLGISILEEYKCGIIRFYEALNQYNLIEASGLRYKTLWKVGFLRRICSCFAKNEFLDQQTEEECEKIVKFAYSTINFSNTFHKNLLISACIRIFKITEIPDDPELIIIDLTKRIKFDSDVLLLGFLNVLFLDVYFSDVLERLEEITRDSKMDLLKTICRLTKINLNFLRRKKMNRLINHSQKCLELIFFVFAGICLFFVELLQQRCRNVFKVLNDRARDNLDSVLEMARKAYINQVTQI